MAGYCHKLLHDRFLSNNFQLIIHYHRALLCYRSTARLNKNIITLEDKQIGPLIYSEVAQLTSLVMLHIGLCLLPVLFSLAEQQNRIRIT
jgi:hypothetical protein